MKISINVTDNVICVDEVCKTVVLPDMQGVIALQWEDGKGHLEYSNKSNTEFTDLTPYYGILSLWGALPLVPSVTVSIPRTDIPAITPWQVRKVLNASGLRASVEAAVSAASVDAQDAWHYATEFRRDDELLNAMAATVGISQEQLDQLFVQGAKL